MKNSRILKIALVLMLLTTSAFADSWFVCLGSFTRLDYASEYCTKLQSQGYSVVIEPSVINNRQYFRIILDQRYSDRNLARSKKNEIAKKLNKNDLWIINTELKNSIKPEALITRPQEKPAAPVEPSRSPIIPPAEAAKSVAAPVPLPAQVAAVEEPEVQDAAETSTEVTYEEEIPSADEAETTEETEIPAAEENSVIDEVTYIPEETKETAAETSFPETEDFSASMAIDDTFVETADEAEETETDSTYYSEETSEPEQEEAPAQEPQIESEEQPAEEAEQTENPLEIESDLSDIEDTIQPAETQNEEPESAPKPETVSAEEPEQEETPAEESANLADEEISSVPVLTYSYDAPYTVCFGYYSTKSAAEKDAEKLSLFGVESFIIKSGSSTAFSYYLNSGVFLSKEDAQTYQAELASKELKNTSIKVYDQNLEEEITAAETAFPENENAGYSKITVIPSILSDNVKNAYLLTPFFSDYRTLKFELFDTENIKAQKSNLSKTQVKNVNYSDYKIDAKKILGATYAEYSDTLLEKKICVEVNYGKKGAFSNLFKAFSKDTAKIPAKINGQSFEFVFAAKNDSNLFLGKDKDSKALVIFESATLTKDELTEIILNSDNQEKAYTINPVCNAFSSIPEGKAYQKAFLSFSLKYLDDSYGDLSPELTAGLKGKYKAETNLKIKKNNYYITFTDCAYESEAKTIYQAFSSVKEKNLTAPMKVKGTPTNYYKVAPKDSIEFQEGPFIFTVLCDNKDKLDKNDLKTVGEQLKFFN